MREATQGTWIEDPIGDQRRTRIQTSAVAAGAATVGAFGALLMWMAFERVKGHTTSLGWFGFFLAPFACMMLGLGVGAAGLLLGVIQHEAKPQPSKPHHDSEDARVSGYLTTYIYELISLSRKRHSTNPNPLLNPPNGSTRSSTPSGRSSTPHCSRPLQTCSKTPCKPPYPRWCTESA